MCAQEWALAEGFLGKGVLPNCDNLVKREEECQGMGTFLVSAANSVHLLNLFMHVGGENSTVLMEQIMIESTFETVNHSGIVCAEGYYLNGDSLCRPLCSLWLDPPGVGLTSGRIAVSTVMISAVIALFSSITAITLALTIQRSTM